MGLGFRVQGLGGFRDVEDDTIRASRVLQGLSKGSPWFSKTVRRGSVGF